LETKSAMSNKKNYYRILGVLQDAEDIVIRAAYKALAQKYHPDKFQGDAKHAKQRMQEINEAYSILSDAIERQKYDSEREKPEYGDESTEETDDLLHTLDKDWAEAAEYFPDLIGSAHRLSRYSSQLEFTFMVMVIEKRDFNNRLELEKILKESYLNKYFGTNKEIHKFAEILFSQNRRDVLQKLNRAVNLLGNDVAPGVIIDKIKIDFPEYKNNSASPYVEHETDFSFKELLIFSFIVVILTIISMFFLQH
jgi:curved DNA-binding protein CbpA